VLTLLDSDGREIAYNDDAYIFKDAQLAHTFPKAGDYFLVVSASFERSARDAEYRLQATQGPFAVKPMPLGAMRGTTAEIAIRGWNLDRAQRVWLDHPNLAGEITSRSPGELKVRLHIPADAKLGPHQLHLSGGGPPVRFEIGDLPESAVTSKAVSAPSVVNGEIPASGTRQQRFQDIAVEVKAGERLEFAVDSWNLGQLMDPVIALFDRRKNALAGRRPRAEFLHSSSRHA
jgi:hypothetical protein